MSQDREAQERRRERQIRRENLAEHIRARTPFWRSRIDRSTGRQHKDPVNRDLYRGRLESFRDMNERNARLRAELERQVQAVRNQRHVRDSLAARDPQFARTVERAVEHLSPRDERGARLWANGSPVSAPAPRSSARHSVTPSTTSTATGGMSTPS